MNELETAILEEIANSHPTLMTNLQAHYSVLRIKNRKYTGVGMFVNFKYENLALRPIVENHLGGNAELLIPKLKFPVTYEIAITDGMIDFLELVANDRDWDGKFDGFKLTR